MAVAKAKGSKIGREKGLTFETKKSKEIKEKIQHINLGHCTGTITIKLLSLFINLNKLQLSKKIKV